MYLHDAEVVELGPAEELIQDDFSLDNTEGTVPSRVKLFSTVYAADAE
jgi:hypothetical protein